MSADLARLAAIVHRHTGIATKDQQLPSLAAALRRAAPGMDAESFLAEVSGAGAGSPLISRLVDEVTVKETYFYRAPRELEAVPWRRLHEAAVARGRDTVRVWVSACATGEEAYTLAILAREAFGAPPPVTILATDISQAALGRAAAADYSPRAVGSLPADLRERYFVREDERHVLRNQIKSLVELRRHNLIADPIPGSGPATFDVVACRNVLIYFDRPTVERVLASLRAALIPAGHLILGAADALPGTSGILSLNGVRPQPAERRRPSPQPRPRPRRRPEQPPAAPIDGIARALAAADAGDLDTTIALTGEILAGQPLDAEAHFLRGLAELGSGRPALATEALRRALYVDPSFGLAAFQLARAHDAMGDDRAARRAYAQALDALQADDVRHARLLGKVTVADVADACRARLLAAPARA